MLPDLALVGRKRVGKNTVGRILEEEFGYTQMGLADPIREVMHAMNPLLGKLDGLTLRYRDAIEAYGGYEAAKDAQPEIRRLMQEHGTYIRGLDQYFWCNQLWWRWCEKCRRGDRVVITDMRFLNEADFFRNRRFLVVRVVNPRVAADDTHVSEIESDQIVPDHVILNASGLDELRAQVRQLIKSITWDTHAAAR